MSHTLQLTPQDVEILSSVHELRIAHVDHLAALHPRNLKGLYRRLQQLHEARYLACLTRRPQKHLYAIGSEAVPVLIEHGYATDDLSRKRLRNQELKEIWLKHFLLVVNVHCALILQTRGSSIRLARWAEGPSLFDSVTVSSGPHDRETIPVRPDAFFTIQDTARPEGKNKLDFFLEADRSTMAHSRMETKVRGYVNYFQQGLHTRKHGIKFFRVLTVTETAARSQSLAASLRKVIPADALRWYHFLPLSGLSLSALLPESPAAVKDAPPIPMIDRQATT
jgi:Replication-relaxation